MDKGLLCHQSNKDQNGCQWTNEKSMFLKFCVSFYGLGSMRLKSQFIDGKKKFSVFIFTFCIMNPDFMLKRKSSHLYSRQFCGFRISKNGLITKLYVELMSEF